MEMVDNVGEECGEHDSQAQACNPVFVDICSTRKEPHFQKKSVNLF